MESTELIEDVEVFVFLLVIALAVVIPVLLLMRIDWTPGRYKIVYHRGPTVDLSTRVSSGWLRFAEGAIAVEGKQEAFTIPVAALRSVEVFRLHGIGRMIRIVHGESTLMSASFAFASPAALPSSTSSRQRRWPVVYHRPRPLRRGRSRLESTAPPAPNHRRSLSRS